jgi:predicted enzyme related to lactoylglutathione lyase
LNCTNLSDREERTMAQQSGATFVSNGIGHFDIEGPDIATLGAFYGSVFGWNVNVRGPGYAMLETPAGAPNGALVESEEATFTVGIVVPHLDAALAAAAANGGTIVLPATNNGWVTKAQVADPAGNRVTLIQG